MMTTVQSILDWIEAERVAVEAQAKADSLLETADSAEPPLTLRKACQRDILPGQIVWIDNTEYGDGWCWVQVKEAYQGRFLDHQGCVLDLEDDCYVEQEKRATGESR